MIVYGVIITVAVAAFAIGVILGRLFTRPTRHSDLTISLLPDDQGQIEAGLLTHAAELVIVLFSDQGEQR